MNSAQSNSLKAFSIGHSNHPIERFLELLRVNQIEVVVDARSQPYSKYSPQFDGAALKSSLINGKIRYLFLGKELGGRPEGKNLYDSEGYVLYNRVAESAPFLEGIKRLMSGIVEYRVAILCSEEDPTYCHRRLLVGRVLAENGFQIEHIRGDGRIQLESSFMKKPVEQVSLFGETPSIEWKSKQPLLQKKYG